jgi:hypothetical protein
MDAKPDFDLLMNCKSIKKSMLILLSYNLYLEVKFEDAESISEIFNERYNYIQYNKNYKEWRQYQSRIKEVWDFIKLSVELYFVNYISNHSLFSEYYK